MALGLNSNVEKIYNTEEEAFLVISESLKDPMILNLLKQLEKYDSYTFKHCIAVAEKSYELGIQSKLDSEDMQDLIYAALLHDIGKIFIDKNILNKEGKLTDLEYEIIKMHAEIGADYIKQKKCFHTDVIDGIRYHHENYNGTGYYGLKGEEIPFLSRIIRIADTYSAMIDKRCYHDGKIGTLVLKEMAEFKSLDKKLFSIANVTYKK